MLPTRRFFSPGVQVSQMTSMMTSSEAGDIHPNENPGRKPTRSPQPEEFPGAYYVMYILFRCDLGQARCACLWPTCRCWRWNRSGHISSSIETSNTPFKPGLHGGFKSLPTFRVRLTMLSLSPPKRCPSRRTRDSNAGHDLSRTKARFVSLRMKTRP